MRAGSLFSGIGGFDLGLERAGHEIIWQVENDPYCQKVLAKHWPDVPCHKDVHDVGAHNLEKVEVICGGFPCQPVSVAGKQLAQDDERWLWPQFAGIVGELRPRYVLVENVPGILVRGLGDVLGDLAELGYDAEWGSVSAASVGAPHLRKRIFIVAHREREGLEGHAGDGDHGHESRRLKARPDRPTGEGCLPTGEARSLSSWWSIESSVGRVVDGLPNRVDRLRGLGNAIVPQVAEWIGRQL